MLLGELSVSNRGEGSWPNPDNYNTYFTKCDDYNNWIYAQAAVLPSDFESYKTWVKDPKNRQIMADLRDAAGVLTRWNSQYETTFDYQITNAISNLDTWPPQQVDYENLINNVAGILPEANNFDLNWNTAQPYLDYINGLNIPQHDSDFKDWISTNRQVLADLYRSLNQLIDKYQSPYSLFFHKTLNDILPLGSPAATMSDLTAVSRLCTIS